MKDSWTSCTIEDLRAAGHAELKTGPFGTQLHSSDYVQHGTPVINVRNIGFGEIREADLEFISEETVQRLSSHLLQPGDIVFGRKGAVERHAFISYTFLTETHKQWMINQCSHGSTMASLNQDIICRIPLSLPPIATQYKIAAVLSAYDDLIENNSRRIAILEEMAQALYREWFVHFRFPGHEQVRMIASAMGLVPEGWEVVPLRDVTSYINRGVSPKYDDSACNMVINQKCIRGGRLDLGPTRRHSTKVPDQKMVRFGDVLINSTGIGTLGRVAQVYQELSNYTVDSHVSIVRPKEPGSFDYLGLTLVNLQPHFDSLYMVQTSLTVRQLRRHRQP